MFIQLLRIIGVRRASLGAERAGITVQRTSTADCNKAGLAPAIAKASAPSGLGLFSLGSSFVFSESGLLHFCVDRTAR
jgi:hypothetical protein